MVKQQFSLNLCFWLCSCDCGWQGQVWSRGGHLLPLSLTFSLPVDLLLYLLLLLIDWWPLEGYTDGG